MPFPIYDVVPCMKISAEKTENVMKKIQDILHRNVSPKRYTNGHAFRLQQVNGSLKNFLLVYIFIYANFSRIGLPIKLNSAYG